MSRPSKAPVTFDEHLGRVIDGALKSYGGRPAVERWLPLSDRSVERRMRGEVPIFASELRVIAQHINWPIEQIVQRALDNYGGIDRLISESSVSEPVDSVAERRKAKQQEAKSMTTEQLESRKRRAAINDEELEQPESEAP